TVFDLQLAIVAPLVGKKEGNKVAYGVERRLPSRSGRQIDFTTKLSQAGLVTRSPAVDVLRTLVQNRQKQALSKLEQQPRWMRVHGFASDLDRFAGAVHVLERADACAVERLGRRTAFDPRPKGFKCVVEPVERPIACRQIDVRLRIGRMPFV